MIKNMSSTDRNIRLLVAAVIIGLYFTNIISGTLAIVLGIAAGIFLLTSLVNFCPLYRVLGISTCAIKK
jgi:hypothetical protein